MATNIWRQSPSSRICSDFFIKDCLTDTSVSIVNGFWEVASGSTDWTKSLTDTITLNDSIGKLSEIIKADIITLSDIIGKLFEGIKSDIITLNDGITKFNIEKNRSDTITLNDNINNESGFNRTLADNITLNDLISNENRLEKNDSIILNDNYNFELGKELNLSDSITLNDLLSGKNIETIKIDVITLNDSIKKDNERYENDIITLNDNISKENEKQVADNITLNDDMDIEWSGATSYYGTLKRWNGINWVKCSLDVFKDNLWQDKKLRVWTGSAWEEVDKL